MHNNPVIIFQIYLATVLFLVCQADFIKRNTEDGHIVGRTFKTLEEKKTCFAFQGIPFAEPPKRFEPPVPKVPWKGVLNCTYDKSECVQGMGPVTGSEDCLFLSVYSPKLTGKAAVLFWIHGGSFYAGNGSYIQNGPDYFLDRGLVVVVIQYRLGVFGFMSTGDLVCPGNLGLKDQALALDWTRRNIHHFGGDPDRITVGGVSAGAASAGYFLLSPKTKGKFNGIIMNSGNPECLWSLNRVAVETAFAIGGSLGYITNSSADLVAFLKDAQYDELQIYSMAVSTQMWLQNFLTTIQFGVVEEVDHEGAFYTGRADEMFSKGDFHRVPILAGFTGSELASYVAPDRLPIFNIVMSYLDQTPENLTPASLTTNETDKASAALDIRLKFFNNTLPMVTQTEQSVNLVNVDLFVKPIERFIRNVMRYEQRTYFYMFNYTGVLGGVTTRYLPGAQHVEDMGYLWVTNMKDIPQEDRNMRDKMVTMWSNFCLYGRPFLQNVIWLPASWCHPPFLMNLDSRLGRIINPYQTYLTFFQNDIFDKYGQGDYDTY